MQSFRRYAAAIAVFGTALYAALVIAAFGMTSLYLDRDVIVDRTIGPLVGPAMTAAAIVLVLIVFLSIALRVPPERQRVAPGLALLLGLAAYLLFCATGAVLVGAATGDLFGLIAFLGLQTVSPFAWAVGALAFVVTVLFQLVLASRVGERGRPRWPWERDEDD